MAGYMYLGNKKVCPAILVGSQPEPPEYDSLIKFPDEVTKIDLATYKRYPLFQLITGVYGMKILLDLNNVEEISGGSIFSGGPFDCFIRNTDQNESARFFMKAENLKSISGLGFYNCFETLDERTNPIFYKTELSLPKLEEINSSRCFGGFFGGGLTDIYLPKLKTANASAFVDALRDIQGSITLHFASNQESLISSLNGYPNFGSSYSVTILYDQPPTE